MSDPKQVLLEITLPGQDSPSMRLYEDDMVLAPSEQERPGVVALLIEALAILAPPNPRCLGDRFEPEVLVGKKLHVVKP